MNEWSATVWASISAMMAALVLTLIVVLGSMARESANVQHQEDLAVALVQEQRKYVHYNEDARLMAQDIISAIAESRGFPETRVFLTTPSEDGSNYAWRWYSPSNPWPSPLPEPAAGRDFTDLSVTGVTRTFEAISNADRFSAEIRRDANGAVVGIWFRRV
ncbi:hypothetical protein ACF3MZ_07110 [Paenibacillaceae bacterium WGS1546]|uniref:hypothetical protein n=1 Tax=Cohnella sp. WGS1546 TaxID=3366810 RepID=UPI00372D7218